MILNDARGWAKATLPTYQDRKAFFEGIVNGDPDPVELIRDGRERDVLELIDAPRSTSPPHPQPAKLLAPGRSPRLEPLADAGMPSLSRNHTARSPRPPLLG